ncbi:MAG: tetratricopeptide repeat protein [Saprospiraceae bacterium]|nr:tetratricopeptide repeat protein [Saprospiraceae bacterium]
MNAFFDIFIVPMLSLGDNWFLFRKKYRNSMIMKVLIVHLAFILFCNISASAQTIQMEKVGRTYRLPCTVNGLPLQFILDTGEDKVIISLAEAMFMLKNGYLDKNSLLGTEYFRLANGEITEGTSVILSTVVIGGLTIRNVQASIIHNADAPLLFGQSALEKLGKVTIDYPNNQLIIGEKQEVYATEVGSGVDYYIRGYNKILKGDFRGALEDYNIAIELEPEESHAYNNRGGAKAELGDIGGAIKDYSKAIEINPNYSDAYYNKAISIKDLGDLRGAIQNYDKAIEINPNFTGAYINRGVVKSELGDNRGAIEDYSKAIEINPNHSDAFYNRASSKEKLGDYHGAIGDYTKAIYIDPTFTSAFYNRAMAKDDLGDYQGAIQDFTRAIDLNPNASDALSNRGNSKKDLGDFLGAIEDYNKAIEISPTLKEAFIIEGLQK